MSERMKADASATKCGFESRPVGQVATLPFRRLSICIAPTPCRYGEDLSDRLPSAIRGHSRVTLCATIITTFRPALFSRFNDSVRRSS
jgi:hypothetical protein